jgi:hypothetical protein
MFNKNIKKAKNLERLEALETLNLKVASINFKAPSSAAIVD